MLGSNPLPSTAAFAAKGGSPQTASQSEEEHITGQRKAEPPGHFARSSGDSGPPAPTSEQPHSEDEYRQTLAAIVKQVKLAEVKDEEFRRVLDPDSEADALELAWAWDDERQDQFVALLQPAHLSLLMHKRLETGLVHRAKTLTFRHLTIVQRGTEVLTDATGDLRGGEMVGLIGGPDSGVSPLLSALSQQIDKRRIKGGEVLYNDHPPTHGYQQAAGFAVKQDSHISALTVYESLYFSARNRLPDRLPNSAIRLRVKIVMKLLGLSHVADTVVGDAMTRGISGGEKRRLGFGLEMVAGHSVVLADLPTNGLDSATAFGLLQTMSYATRMGIGVMLSLVQASLELLTVLDRLMLLCKGRIIFIGKLDQVEGYLKDAGFVRPKKKALPQFLEELSSRPEQFYKATPGKQPKSGEEEQKKMEPQQMSHSPSGKPKGAGSSSPREGLQGSGRREESRRGQPSEGGQPPSPDPKHENVEQGKANAAAGRSPRGDDRPQDDQREGEEQGVEQGREKSGEQSSPTRVAFQRLVDSWKKSDINKENLRRVKEDKKHPRGDNGGGEGGAEGEKGGDGGNGSGQPIKEEQEQKSQGGPAHGPDQATAAAAAGSRFAASHLSEGLRPTQWTQYITPQQPPPQPTTGPSTPHGHSRSVPNDRAHSGDDSQQRPHPNNSRSGQQRKKQVSWLWRRWYAYYNSGPLLQFQQNLYRYALLTFRNTGLWRDIWILAALIGVIIGSLFYQLGVDEVGVRNRLGCYFYIISYLGFNAVQLVPVLASQRTVLSNETRSGYYHHFAYFFSLLLVQLPIVLVEALLVLTPIWGLSRLQGMDWGGRFWFAYLVVSLTSYTSRAFMFVVYGLSPNEAYADVLNQVCNIIFTKLCGYFIPQREIVVGWHWVYYLSYFTFAFRALALNDINPITRDCVPSPNATCLFTTGGGALELLYTIDPSWSKWLQVEYLFDFFLVFSAIGFGSMWQIDWAVTEDWELPYFQSEKEIKEEQQSSNQQQQQQQQSPQQQQDTARSASPKSGQATPAGGREGGGVARPSHEAPHSTRRYSDIVLVDDDGEHRREGEEMDEAVQGDLEEGRMGQGHLPRPSAFHYQHRVVRRDPSPDNLKRRRACNREALEQKQGDQGQQQHQRQLQRGRERVEQRDDEPSADVGQQGSSQQKAKGLQAKKKHGVTLEFYQLNYSVDVKGGRRRLLHEVYGYCTPGMMVALMGATGAGKSTLLDLLANKKTGGHVTGHIWVNGQERDRDFQHLAGYVEQFDSLYPWSTIRESLHFSGRLRLPPDVSEEELEQKVDRTLRTLGLSHLQHELIGGAEIGGVSQEVRKKVTIGVELMLEPELLFLDEPTTGLGFTSHIVRCTRLSLLLCPLIAASISRLCCSLQASTLLLPLRSCPPSVSWPSRSQ